MKPFIACTHTKLSAACSKMRHSGRVIQHVGLSILGLCIGMSKVYAANLAYDDASDTAYGAGWTNGSNGGFGFGSWIFLSLGTNTLHTIQTSTLNGDGDGNADGDIDSAGVAWGLASGEASAVYAIRPFTGGDLLSGQYFSVQFDSGLDFDPDKSASGIGFYDSGMSLGLFSFYKTTNAPTYFYVDAAGVDVVTSIPVTDEGGWLTFQMTGPTSYLATVTLLTGGSYAWSGDLLAAPGVFLAFSGSVETGSTDEPYRFLINRMEVVPEPRGLALILGGAASIGIAALRTRKLRRLEPADRHNEIF